MFGRGLILLAISLLLSACSADNSSVAQLPTAPSELTILAGTSWLLQRLGDVEVIADAQPTLTFANAGQVSGNSSCNHFSGRARIDGTSIAFGPLAVTRMACAERIMRQEQQYLDALARTQRFELRDTQLLVFTTAGPEPLRFAPR
jgi:heat shock protein HslJ